MSNRRGSNKPSQKAGTQPSPWPKRLIAAAGVGLVLVLVAAVLFSPTPVSGIPEGTEPITVGPRDHVEGIIYAPEEVPAGGPHNSIWQNCGFYDVPIRAENAVHSLEHGTVWITYDPSLGPNDIDRLRGFSSPLDKVLISPIPGQQSPVMATAWGWQLSLDDPGDPRLEQFVNEFEGSLQAPEPGGRCSGGVGEPVG